jgi:hypothetical protein
MPDDELHLEPSPGWTDAVIRRRGDRLRPPPPVDEVLDAPARHVKQLTGAGLEPHRRWWVCGTDLGVPYLLENGSVGFLFGDTFASPWPEDKDTWRSPVMLRSAVHPAARGGIRFDSAARVLGDGRAPALMDYLSFQLRVGGFDPSWESTRIPNDAVSFPETGRQVLSYMAVYDWPEGRPWRTSRAGLAWSDNGNDFIDAVDATWPNDVQNSSPHQMWTMQRDGEYVYVFSVRAGRQRGPLTLMRVPWRRILEPAAYEPWGWRDGGWAWGNPCTSLFDEAEFGEPSVRRLRDGVWAMSYSLPATQPPAPPLPGRIVTRRAPGPDRPWTKEKVQLTTAQEPALYGGFIHPYSTSAVGDLHLMVSSWERAGNTSRTYHVSQYAGTL